MESPLNDLRDEEQREGYAAIDFGSTATRVCIVVTRIDPITGKRVASSDNLELLQAKGACSDRFRAGEFPSVGCPFDKAPYLVGFDAASQSAKRTISLKSIPYFLARDHDGHQFTKDLYDHHRRLRSNHEKKHFKETLYTMLTEFLTSIIKRIIEKSESDEFTLRKIAMCVPNTWSARDNNIQTILSPILDKAIRCDVEILFMFEAQAQAQFLVHNHSRVLRPFDYLMVIDFGGHSMGGSHGELKWARSDRPRFFSPDRSDFGTRGGYEIWELLIGRRLDEIFEAKIQQKEHLGFFKEDWHIVRAALLKQFFFKKTDPEYQQDRRLMVDLVELLGPRSRSSKAKRKAVFTIKLDAAEVRMAWEEAFREVIDMAKQNILRMAQRNRKTFILLSGGSIENVRARDEIEGYCSKLRLRAVGANIECTHISDKISVKSIECRVAEGGARCLAATMCAEEFFNRGGALALRMSTKWGKWSSDHGKLFFRKQGGFERKHPVEIEMTEDKACRIIADPTYIHQQDLPLKVVPDNCYDIWDVSLKYEETVGLQDLARIPPGKYMFAVAKITYAGTDAEMTLRLQKKGIRPRTTEGSRRSERNVNYRTTLDEGYSLVLNLPLLSDGSNNLVELDRDRIQGRFWRFEEDLEASAASEMNGPNVEDFDSELETPPAKRVKAYGGMVPSEE